MVAVTHIVDVPCISGQKSEHDRQIDMRPKTLFGDAAPTSGDIARRSDAVVVAVFNDKVEHDGEELWHREYACGAHDGGEKSLLLWIALGDPLKRDISVGKKYLSQSSE